VGFKLILLSSAMGACCSQEGANEFVDLDGDHSHGIDNDLLKAEIENIFKFKVLLLGAGGSGKTTIMKQIKDLHGYTLSPDQKKDYGITLHNNVLDCMTALLTAVESFNYQLTESEMATKKKIEDRVDTIITPDYAAEIKALFNGSSCQQAYARRGKDFWLLDSFFYYMDNIDRFAEPDFVPSDEDIVMARIRTTGIQENRLEHKVYSQEPNEPSQIIFNVVDVGGQRSERKKWINCFDNVEAIIFVSNLADYRQVLYEDQTKNGMDESLELFYEVARNNHFRKDVSLFLYLNKKDLFSQYVKQYGMVEQYPDFDGGNDDMKGCKYIEDKFRANCPPTKSVEITVLTARVRREIKAAFDDVKTMLYKKHRSAMIDKVKALKQEQAKLAAANKKGACCC